MTTSTGMEVLKSSVEEIVSRLDTISEIEKAAAGDPRKAAKLEEATEPHKRAIINAGISAAIVLGGSIIRIADALEEIASQGRSQTLRSVAGGVDLGVQFEDKTDKPSRERM